jgi:hypothetical protein
MMKLSGWKRIGIIASVVWILCAGIYTFNSVRENITKYAREQSKYCSMEVLLSGECNKREADYIAAAAYQPIVAAGFVALVPVPLGWGFTYLVLFVVRWVKRGFTQVL